MTKEGFDNLLACAREEMKNVEKVFRGTLRLNGRSLSSRSADPHHYVQNRLARIKAIGDALSVCAEVFPEGGFVWQEFIEECEAFLDRIEYGSHSSAQAA